MSAGPIKDALVIVDRPAYIAMPDLVCFGYGFIANPAPVSPDSDVLLYPLT